MKTRFFTLLFITLIFSNCASNNRTPAEIEYLRGERDLVVADAFMQKKAKCRRNGGIFMQPMPNAGGCDWTCQRKSYCSSRRDIFRDVTGGSY